MLGLGDFCCGCEGSHSSYHSPACDAHSCTGVVDKVEAETTHHAIIIYNLVKILSCQRPILTAVHKPDTDITLRAGVMESKWCILSSMVSTHQNTEVSKWVLCIYMRWIHLIMYNWFQEH